MLNYENEIEILRVEKQNIEAENKRKSEFNSIGKWKKKKKKKESIYHYKY